MDKFENVPELRFEGFTDDWKQRKLGEVVESIGTGNSQFKLNSQKLVFYPYAVLGSTSIIGYDNTYDYDGNFILTARVGANAGDLYSFNGKVKITDNTVYIQAKNSIFLYYLLYKTSLKKLSFGTGQPLIKSSDLKKLKLSFPMSIEEQKAIGEFFKQLDSTIDFHQREWEKYKNLKISYLEKMFPRENQNEPELRFKNFTDPWVQRKLGEDVEFFSGLTYSPSNITDNTGVLVIRSSNIQDSFIDLNDNVYVKREFATSEKVAIGDIVVVVRNGSRNLIGKHAIITTDMKDTVIGAFMTGIRSNSSSFINALLNTNNFHEEVAKNLGATINQITLGMFKNMTFYFPSLAEQQAIGEFFRQLDDTITTHQRELEKYKKLKEGYLQKMFV